MDLYATCVGAFSELNIIMGWRRGAVNTCSREWNTVCVHMIISLTNCSKC